MKLFKLYILLLFANWGFSQTFINNTAGTIPYSTPSWNAPLIRTISVSGVGVLGSAANVLQQINLNLGNGSTQASYDKVQVRVKAPGGTTVIIFNTDKLLGPGSSSTNYRKINIKLRDHAALKTPKQYSFGEEMEPFNLGFYRCEVAGAYAGFNGLNSTGTWTVEIEKRTNFETFTFNQVDLVFGSQIIPIDLTSSKTNDACSAPTCFSSNQTILGTIFGYSDPNCANCSATDPPISLSGCAWNNTQNKSAWYFFKASGTTANVSISGITPASTGVQSLIVAASTSCTPGGYSVPTGGCPTVLGDTHINTNGNYSTGSGSRLTYNQAFALTGLIAGNFYYLIIDGNGTTQATYYVDMQSGGVNCSVVLPIELLYFNGQNNDTKNVLNWASATELNNAYFEIEKSTDAINFETLTKINSQAVRGNSTTQLNYNYTDLACNAYYRLKQVDFDGRVQYHNTVFIANTDDNSKPLIMPNPATNELSINFNSKSNQGSTIKLCDVSGREILTEQAAFNNDNQTYLLNIEALKAGLYFLTIDTGFKTYQQKIVKE